VKSRCKHSINAAHAMFMPPSTAQPGSQAAAEQAVSNIEDELALLRQVAHSATQRV
jgi:hypothetical protein